MRIRSLVYSLLITLLSGCIHTKTDWPKEGSTQLNDATPWQARGKMLISSESERQTLRFSWSHFSEDQDRVELRDTLGLRSVVLVKDSGRYYQENKEGQRVLLSANTLEQPLAALLSSLPSDIARLMTGRGSSNNQVTSKVVSWSTSAKFATPEILSIHLGDYAIKIIISHWEIDSSD